MQQRSSDDSTDDMDVGFVLYVVRGAVAICVASLVVAIARMLTGGRASRVSEGVAVAVGGVVVLPVPVLIAARARRDTAPPAPERAARTPSDPPAAG